MLMLLVSQEWRLFIFTLYGLPALPWWSHGDTVIASTLLPTQTLSKLKAALGLRPGFEVARSCLGFFCLASLSLHVVFSSIPLPTTTSALLVLSHFVPIFAQAPKPFCLSVHSISLPPHQQKCLSSFCLSLSCNLALPDCHLKGVLLCLTSRVQCVLHSLLHPLTHLIPTKFFHSSPRSLWVHLAFNFLRLQVSCFQHHG